jgi:DNA-binding MarR family transcriptional regulator
MTSVVDSLRSIIRTLRVAARESEQKLGISGAQLYILQELQDSPGQSVNQLAERTSTHQSSVSTVVAKLVERGLVSRSAARGDARRLSLSLSPAGRTLLKRSPKAEQGRLVAALRNMPPGELDGLAHGLAELTSILAASAPENQQKSRLHLES